MRVDSDSIAFPFPRLSMININQSASLHLLFSSRLLFLALTHTLKINLLRFTSLDVLAANLFAGPRRRGPHADTRVLEELRPESTTRSSPDLARAPRGAGDLEPVSTWSPEINLWQFTTIHQKSQFTCHWVYTTSCSSSLIRKYRQYVITS